MIKLSLPVRKGQGKNEPPQDPPTVPSKKLRATTAVKSPSKRAAANRERYTKRDANRFKIAIGLLVAYGLITAIFGVLKVVFAERQSEAAGEVFKLLSDKFEVVVVAIIVYYFGGGLTKNHR